MLPYGNQPASTTPCPFGLTGGFSGSISVVLPRFPRREAHAMDPQ